MNPLITVITPTTGKDSLFELRESLSLQSVPHVHMVLWDDKRDGHFSKTGRLYPSDIEGETDLSLTMSVVIKGSLVSGQAYGSAMRAVGLMAANTPYVCFADDDVWFESNHMESLLKAIDGKNWAYCIRDIWSNDGLKYIGEDRFESIGDESKLPYKLVDNSSLIFKREFGASAACLYRETKEYNDDRLMFQFMTKYAGVPGKSGMVTVNQRCPIRLETFFRLNCVPNKNKTIPRPFIEADQRFIG